MEHTPALPPPARMDGFGEILQSIGNTRQYGNTILNLGGNFGARWAYAQGGIVARIVDTPADMATAKGVTVKDGGDQVAEELERLKVMPALSNALRWALLDGGGALIVLTKDGGSLEDPLDPENLQEIEELRVVSVVEMRGDTQNLYDDESQANYGEPQFYLVNAKRSTLGEANQYRVHETRVISVPGAPTVTIAGADFRDIPWAGRGVDPSAIRAIERYRRSLGWAEKLLERSQQAVHKMKGLAEQLMLGPAGESVVRARINMVDSNRSAINGVAVDGEDDYTITSASLTGVKDTIEQMQTAVAAETGYPQTLLFGRSPGGLNSTGDGDWALVYSYVSQLQQIRLSPALERIVSLIYAQSTVTDAPEGWRICWNPLAEMTAQQAADVDNKKADTLKKIAEAVQTIVGTGAVSEDEAHEWLQSEHYFGLEEPGEGGQGAARRYAGQTE